MFASRIGMGAYWFFCIGIAFVSLVTVGVAGVTTFDGAMPHLAHYFPAHAIPLLMHIVLAPIALITAPFQLWNGLRQRIPRIHRLSGYVYVSAIVLSGLGSLAMLPGFKGSSWAATGFGVLAVLSVGATLRGVWLARQRDFVAHRRWMLRSVALIFAAVTLRIGAIPLMIGGMTLVESYNVTAWASWLVPLVVVEWWQSRRPMVTVVR